MKYLFFIAVYKRLEITRKCFENLKALSSKFDINVFCVCSSVDEAELCNEFGWDWTIAENFPLGAKFNSGLKEAMNFDFDRLIQIGSDDIITEDLLIKYREVDAPYFGIRRAFITNGESAKIWDVYETNKIHSPIGAGRVFTRETLLEVLKKGDLWPNEIRRGLDGASDTQMMIRGFRCKLIDFEGIGIISLKSDVNIWKFEDMNNCGEVEMKDLEPYL